MPAFDGTGPLGLGPGTGWGLGPCGAGFGWRRGWGRVFGRRRFWSYPYPKIDEKEWLENELKALEEEMKEIKARLAELSKDGDKKR